MLVSEASTLLAIHTEHRTRCAIATLTSLSVQQTTREQSTAYSFDTSSRKRFPCLACVAPALLYCCQTVTVKQALCGCDPNQKLFTIAKRHLRAACRCFTTLISTSIQHLVNLLYDVRQLCVGGYQQNIVPTTCLDVHIKPLHTLGICTTNHLVREECADFDLRVFFVVCVGGAYPGLVAADHHSAHIVLHPAIPCAVHTAIRGSNDTGNGMRWYCQSSR